MDKASLSFGWELFVAQTTSQLCHSLGFGEPKNLHLAKMRGAKCCAPRSGP